MPKIKATMNDALQQPGLNSLSKSFEPAALEAHWGPEWEKRGYGVAGSRGTGQPSLDAAARGLRVVLVESHDFAKGTSSRSTKLVHGGVRYLAQGNISLVREALHERTLLLNNASYLAQPLPFGQVMLPLYHQTRTRHQPGHLMSLSLSTKAA